MTLADSIFIIIAVLGLAAGIAVTQGNRTAFVIMLGCVVFWAFVWKIAWPWLTGLF